MTTTQQLPTRIYTPASPLAQPAQLWRDMATDLWAGRELAWRLAQRDISAQYRQSALGVLWALIIPLANTAVWLFLTGSKVHRYAAVVDPDRRAQCAAATGECQQGAAGQDQLPPRTAGHHGLDGDADAPQPAHTADAQCPRLVHRLAMPILIERMTAL